MERFEQQDLFASGVGGYVRYRIPALVVTTRDTLLAFCEARMYTGADSDQIDLFLRRSEDGGRTFGPPQRIATQPDWVCGNPAPVVDRVTGVIWLPFCKNRRDGDETMICEGNAPRTVWLTHSRDDGTTWAEPVEITARVKPADWSWYATGPCHGIQLERGPHAGRLVVPCDHIVMRARSRCDDPYHSHILYSDDHGATWHLGGDTDEGANESACVETADGWLYLNSRNKRGLPEGGNYRAVAWSQDGGASFAPTVRDAALPEPICQASVCRCSLATAAGGRNRVVFANPAALTGRYHVTVRLSYDECRTWPVARVLHEGPAAYSDLCVTPEGDIGCLYERGDEGPYERLTFARFNLAWLTRGRDGG
ncbi:MAG: sialidase family protein [Chloroflexota bacterium]